ncbi:MAG: CBS domain-containing protein [Candidatus Zixiibacteriota bacterium]
MEMKCAGEMMIPLSSFPYVPYWFTFRQALAELESVESRRGPGRNVPWVMLVFSAQNQLLGLVQRRDMLQGLRRTGNKTEQLAVVPEAAGDFDLYHLGFNAERAVQELRGLLEKQIIEFMTPIHATVESNTPALLVMYLMIDRNLTFIPVVEGGKITGIIYAEDAIGEIIARAVRE